MRGLFLTIRFLFPPTHLPPFSPCSWQRTADTSHRESPLLSGRSCRIYRAISPRSLQDENLPSLVKAMNASNAIEMKASSPLATRTVVMDKKFDDSDSDITSDHESEIMAAPTKLRDLASTVDQFPGLKREKWWWVFRFTGPDSAHSDRQIWRPKHAPAPPKASLDDAEVIPLSYVNIFSQLTFQVSLAVGGGYP